MTNPANANQARANAFRDYNNILTNNALDLTADANAKRDYLQDIHKEIAIRRITMYLAAHAGREAVNAADLPIRTAGDRHANALARNDDNDYRNYAAFIRNAGYDEQGVNDFVVEITGKINTARQGVEKVNN